ncbi:hypothetical protein IJI72_01855 [Candidatus Saccharibacteria bacterium]|nr:hypothetical protein [Candidatus Saccharibacteria bacterium]
MSHRDLRLANHHALLSVDAFNKSALSRRYHRWKYRQIAEREYWSAKHQTRVGRYYAGELQLNTYPWPYRDPGFANWTENDTPGSYTLISDPSGCVVRHSTSYCAYKIRELTGFWPKRLSNTRFDAKHWQQFLAEAGYAETLPSGVVPTLWKHYVGIDPQRGAYGLVVWFEGYSGNYPGSVQVSTYLNQKYLFISEDWKKYLWVEIPEPPAPRPKAQFTWRPSQILSRATPPASAV